MKVGSLVELVKPFKSQPSIGEIYPVFEKVYTVRNIVEYDIGLPLLQLSEIINPLKLYRQGFLECGFLIDNFRELLPPIANIEETIKENTLTPHLWDKQV